MDEILKQLLSEASRYGNFSVQGDTWHTTSCLLTRVFHNNCVLSGELGVRIFLKRLSAFKDWIGCPGTWWSDLFTKFKFLVIQPTSSKKLPVPMEVTIGYHWLYYCSHSWTAFELWMPSRHTGWQKPRQGGTFGCTADEKGTRSGWHAVSWEKVTL